MKQLIKKIISQKNINNFYHLPKAVLANIFYGFPARGLTVIGVTGTDGKTTTTNMVYQILKDAGKKVSMVSTINSPGLHVTSPDPFTIQKIAKESVKKGDEYLVLEVTSHALDQYRFWGINFDIGVITNITHEHLDYHKTFENYSLAKFKLIKNVTFTVINQNLKDKVKTSGKLITFGLDKGDFSQKDLKLKLKISGDYNLENALAALSVAFALNIDKKIAIESLENFEGIKGRMEFIKNRKGIKIVIDFAHTPNGLEQVLATLKQQTQNRLISLIGAEGFRDVGKRSLMGEVTQRISNIVIVTSVDPRGQLDIINKQISEGAQRAGARNNINFFVINDRQKAIDFAINILARRGDTVGIFGKGHENAMNYNGKEEIPWSDFEAVDKALNG